MDIETVANPRSERPGERRTGPVSKQRTLEASVSSGKQQIDVV